MPPRASICVTLIEKNKSRRNETTLAVIVLCAINLLNFYDRQAPGALLEPMRREFHLSDTMIGLMGSMFIWVYALVGLPLGRAADVWSRKKLLTAGISVWSLLTAAAGLATGYGFLLVTRLGVGVGEAVCGPVGTSWIGDLFPPERRARVLSLFMLGVPVGGALSFLLCGPIAQRWGWRAALVSAAAPALLLIPALQWVKEPQRGATEATVAGRSTLWSILRIPTLGWIIASGALLNFNLYALATFLPSFLTRVHGYSVARAGVASGIIYLSGGVCGGLLGGYLGDRFQLQARNARLWVAALMALLSSPALLFGVRQPAGAALAACVAIGLGYAAFNTYFGCVYASIQDVVAPDQRGFTMSVYFMTMYLCGASFGPLITGSLSDRMAQHAMKAAGSSNMELYRGVGLQRALLVMPVLSIALAVVLFIASRTIVKDAAQRDARLAAV